MSELTDPPTEEPVTAPQTTITTSAAETSIHDGFDDEISHGDNARLSLDIVLSLYFLFLNNHT